MFKKRISPAVDDLLPWHLNHSMPAAERPAAEDQARRSSQQWHAWQAVRAAALSQPSRVPPAAVRQRVLAQARAASRTGRMPRWLPMLSGAVVAVLALLLLWNVVRPGIGLQWSVNGAVPTAFRVYRAPAGSDRFEILSEIPARAGVMDYTYVDTALWPGQAYQYRVEGVSADAVSETISANGLDVLPAQIAIALSSLLVGITAIIVLHQLARVSFPTRRLAH